VAIEGEFMTATAPSGLPLHDAANPAADIPTLSNPISNPTLRRAKEQILLGTIAHDIRNPITALRGYLKMVLSERLGPLSADQKECLEGAMNGVGQLLRLAGIVGGMAALMEQFEPQIVDLYELWLQTRDAVHSQALKKNIVIEDRPPDEPIIVYGDRQLLANLIEKLALSALMIAGPQAPMHAEWSYVKSGEIALDLRFCSPAAMPAIDTVASELQSIVFLHGGNLTLAKKPADTTNTISSLRLLLPGVRS
jgi:signal transduction histidine kinase